MVRSWGVVFFFFFFWYGGVCSVSGKGFGMAIFIGITLGALFLGSVGRREERWINQEI